MQYYILGLLIIGVGNWLASRYASRQISRGVFAVTALAPMIFWLGLNAWFLIRDGFRTFHDPYFFVLLMTVAGFTVATTISAFLGRDLGLRSRSTQTPR